MRYRGLLIAASTVVRVAASTSASGIRPACNSKLAVWARARITAGCHDSGRSLRKHPPYSDYQPSAREADLVDDAFRGAEIAARAVVNADAVA